MSKDDDSDFEACDVMTYRLTVAIRMTLGIQSGYL